jgi:hypothetical protein
MVRHPFLVTTLVPDPSHQSLGKCIEQTAGVFQVGVQWFLYTVMCVTLWFPVTDSQPPI